MDEINATMALHKMSDFLSRYYGKKVIILLDEYDTPMQEAYVEGYWEKLVSFTRSLFNASFKTNPFLERALMTGITRVSRESVFSDLNNLVVITTTSQAYADSFGFTEPEVFEALKEYSLEDKKQEVKAWYDGFTFGEIQDIYTTLDEQIVFSQLTDSTIAIWSLLLASGYLKVTKHQCDIRTGREYYYLALANQEVRLMFENMIHDWFTEVTED